VRRGVGESCGPEKTTGGVANKGHCKLPSYTRVAWLTQRAGTRASRVVGKSA